LSQILKKIDVAEIMSIKRYQISPEMTVDHAYNLMRAKRIGGVPVIDNGSLVGIITRKDVKTVDFGKRKETQVKKIMTKNPITIFPDEKVSTALDKISKFNVRGMPVVSRTGCLLGFISISDIERALKGLRTKALAAPKSNSCPFCGGILPVTLNKVAVCEHCGNTVRF
jgi:CBS domain-containing protein